MGETSFLWPWTNTTRDAAPKTEEGVRALSFGSTPVAASPLQTLSVFRCTHAQTQRMLKLLVPLPRSNSRPNTILSSNPTELLLKATIGLSSILSPTPANTGVPISSTPSKKPTISSLFACLLVLGVMLPENSISALAFSLARDHAREHLSCSDPSDLALDPFFFPLPPCLVTDFSPSPPLSLSPTATCFIFPELSSFSASLLLLLFRTYCHIPRILRYLRTLSRSLSAGSSSRPSLAPIHIAYQPSAADGRGRLYPHPLGAASLATSDYFYLVNLTLKLTWLALTISSINARLLLYSPSTSPDLLQRVRGRRTSGFLTS